MFIWGADMILHKFNFGTYLGKVKMQAPEFRLEDESGNIYSNADFKNKILVIDFWTTSCGVCFRKFPMVEELYLKTKNKTDIVIVAVNNPLKGDSKNKAMRMIRERGYTFSVMFSELKTTNQNFDFNAYPITFIIKDGSEIIYKGSIEGVEKILKE